MTDEAAGTEDLSQLSYEQAREELVAVVQRLESGGAPLAESLALWERGERLAEICQQWLDGAKAKVEAARASATDETPS
ncbi:exodeoxyribonuclease VII small subunit [Microlunatus elymi]|uniref:Exodeoxyribonuclease 7 small subunit n=1 Tax=Microlunatus elymi TaxID=2596828 RepID=A0A516Q391_9ACTN|nr:exodeoxyribonuclease VII small subunit [Microlunatus elymi]QDP97878.1 exodeoxyribonuclease VII small subunit [Microlunatus elymi]